MRHTVQNHCACHLKPLLITGYNEVVRIPSGATNIDVRQHSYSGKPDDDNYLGKTFILSEKGAIVSVLLVLLSMFSNHLSEQLT